MTSNAVYGQRQKLAGITIPSYVPPAQRAQLEHAVKESFVSGFRASMLVSAALAAVSALFAAWLIAGKQKEPATSLAERTRVSPRESEAQSAS